MTLLKRLFGRYDTTAPTAAYWRYGRFSDAYKSEEQHRAWADAEAAYATGDYHAAIIHLLTFLRNDEGNNVLAVTPATRDTPLRFVLLQGSKQLIGLADGHRITVEAKVAQTTALEVGLMQQLMERNYSLSYSRFALDTDNNIVLRFDSQLADASPYKLNDALREVAINADKLDDLLIERYDSLRPIAVQHLVAASPQERTAKRTYWMQAIRTTLAQVQALTGDELAAGRAYLLLHLTYRLDYLVAPEGYAMETLERLHRQYFAHDGRSINQKCARMQAAFEGLLERPITALDTELYHTISTFGITMPVSHERLVSFIQGELPNTDWYMRHGHLEVVEAITGYIAGYCAFEFALPQLDRELLHLYFEVMEAPLFEQLTGQPSPYTSPQSGLPRKSAIRRRLAALARQYLHQYPQLNLDTKGLQWDSRAAFACSYMELVQGLNLTPATEM